MALVVVATVDQLRGRFHRCRYRRSKDAQDYRAIAKEIGLQYTTLYRFGKGAPAQEETLTKIELWCEREETGHAPRDN